MYTDKTMKVLLAVVALGLWLNLLAPLFHPKPVAAQSVMDISLSLEGIRMDLDALKDGGMACRNKKLCE